MMIPKLKKYTYYIATFCFFAFTASTCDTCKNCNDGPVFALPEVNFEIYPEQLEYHIGDTMYFYSTVSSDTFIPAGVNLFNTRLASNIICRQLEVTDTTTFPFAAKKFDTFILNGKQTSIGRLEDRILISFDWSLIDTNFVVEIGIIPKEAGSFVFGPSSGSMGIKEGLDCENGSGFQINNNNMENNYFLYEQLVDSSMGQWKASGYFFKVIP